MKTKLLQLGEMRFAPNVAVLFPLPEMERNYVFPPTCLCSQNKQFKAAIISVITQQNNPKLDLSRFIYRFFEEWRDVGTSALLLAPCGDHHTHLP